MYWPQDRAPESLSAIDSAAQTSSQVTLLAKADWSTTGPLLVAEKDKLIAIEVWICVRMTVVTLEFLVPLHTKFWHLFLSRDSMDSCEILVCVWLDGGTLCGSHIFVSVRQHEHCQSVIAERDQLRCQVAESSQRLLETQNAYRELAATYAASVARDETASR